MTPTRRLAEGLARAAARMAPADRSEWGTAMLAELDHVSGDGRALRWASGCLLAAALWRLDATELGRGPAARILLALAIGVQVLRALFAPVMVLSWRLGALDVTAALGRQTPGDDYRRFIPLMQAVPDEVMFAELSAAVLFVLAALTIRRGGKLALWLFLGAVLADMASAALGHLSPEMNAARAHAWTFANHSLRRDVLVPLAGILYPAGLALGLWWVSLPGRRRA
jgi:hypothetical protein